MPGFKITLRGEIPGTTVVTSLVTHVLAFSSYVENPAGQLVHLDRPSHPVYKPIVQPSHDTPPDWFIAQPTGHNEHSAKPRSGEYSPGKQSAQLADS